jgi:hypothetical protein
MGSVAFSPVKNDMLGNIKVRPHLETPVSNPWTDADEIACPCRNSATASSPPRPIR